MVNLVHTRFSRNCGAEYRLKASVYDVLRPSISSIFILFHQIQYLHQQTLLDVIYQAPKRKKSKCKKNAIKFIQIRDLSNSKEQRKQSSSKCVLRKELKIGVKKKRRHWSAVKWQDLYPLNQFICPSLKCNVLCESHL